MLRLTRRPSYGELESAKLPALTPAQSSIHEPASMGRWALRWDVSYVSTSREQLLDCHSPHLLIGGEA